jgi:hypothetical protein
MLSVVVNLSWRLTDGKHKRAVVGRSLEVPSSKKIQYFDVDFCGPPFLNQYWQSKVDSSYRWDDGMGHGWYIEHFSRSATVWPENNLWLNHVGTLARLLTQAAIIQVDTRTWVVCWSLYF